MNLVKFMVSEKLITLLITLHEDYLGKSRLHKHTYMCVTFKLNNYIKKFSLLTPPTSCI